MSRWRLVLGALLLGVSVPAVCDAASEDAPGAELSGALLLQRLVDPVLALQQPFPTGARLVAYTSHDRQGGNNDTSTYDPASAVPGTMNYLRREGDAVVLFDEQRPGCLVRTWFTGIGPSGTGDISDFGRLQLFFDGEAEPRLEVEATQLFTGSVPGFPSPLVGDALVSSGGYFSYVPLCYARSLKVRSVRSGANLGWYELEALVVPPGTPVTTFRPDDPAQQAATQVAVAALTRLGEAPADAPAVTFGGPLQPGQQQAVELGGAGHVRFLRFRVEPFDAPTLAALRLQVSTDGSSPPRIDVPFGPLLGDGVAPRPLRAIPFGMDPATGTGYFALPIPYETGVRISVQSAISASAQVDVWLGGALGVAARLHGEHRSETTEIARDYRILDADGSGRLAAVVVDIQGHDGSGGPGQQTYLEGDLRIHVDGSRSPSLYGTGTEDDFNGGFYYTNGPFSLPTHGAGPLVVDSVVRSFQSQYRVFAGGAELLWASSVRYGAQHGANNENVRVVHATTFSYRAAASLQVTDRFQPGDSASESAHGLSGAFERTALTAYFEGEQDGTETVPGVPYGLGSNLAPPPEQSPEGHASPGVRFTGPLSLEVAVDRLHCGVVLRRLLDAGTPSRLEVLVSGASADLWDIPYSNLFKRWLEADFDLPLALTRDRDRLALTLVPQGRPRASTSSSSSPGAAAATRARAGTTTATAWATPRTTVPSPPTRVSWTGAGSTPASPTGSATPASAARSRGTASSTVRMES